MENIANEMKITAVDKANLTTAAKWARFIAIVNFVMIGIGVAAMLFVVLGMAIADMALPGFTEASTTFMLVYMIVMIAVLLIALLPALYLWRFADKALTAVEADDQEAISGSLANLRRYFKFTGVLTIVGLALYALIIIIAIIGGIWCKPETAKE